MSKLIVVVLTGGVCVMAVLLALLGIGLLGAGLWTPEIIGLVCVATILAALLSPVVKANSRPSTPAIRW